MSTDTISRIEAIIDDYADGTSPLLLREAAESILNLIPTPAAAERLRQGLEDVCDPLGYLRRMAEAQGNSLGGMAYQIANDPATLQRIAKDALASAS